MACTAIVIADQAQLVQVDSGVGWALSGFIITCLHTTGARRARARARADGLTSRPCAGRYPSQPPLLASAPPCLERPGRLGETRGRRANVERTLCRLCLSQMAFAQTQKPTTAFVSWGRRSTIPSLD